MLFSRVFPRNEERKSILPRPEVLHLRWALQYPGSNPGADRRFFNAVSDATASGDEL